MYVRCIRNRSTRLLVGLLLLPALAIRALVPPGVMPATGVDDAPTMQMCHGAGPLPASTQPASGGDPSPARGQHHEAPCVFAAAGVAAPPPPAALALDLRHFNDVSTPAPEFVFVLKTLHRIQAARAPPTRIPLA